MEFERNASQCTLRNMRGDLNRFREFLDTHSENIPWQDVDADLIRGWMEQMMDNGTMPSTINQRLSSLRSFFRFCLKRELLTKDPSRLIQGLKKPKTLPTFLREKEMDKLLDDALWSDKYIDVRARTIIILLYETGLRRSELVGLNDVDVDMAQMQLKVTGKRNKQRVVPFGEEVRAQIDAYRQIRDREISRVEDGMFLTKRGRRITVTHVYKAVKSKLSLVTTQKKRSPHVLRHTFATAMLNNEAGLESVQKLLGHTSLNATEIYTHVTFEQLKQVYGNAHPRMDEGKGE